jgi:hypothetical protein
MEVSSLIGTTKLNGIDPQTWLSIAIPASGLRKRSLISVPQSAPDVPPVSAPVLTSGHRLVEMDLAIGGAHDDAGVLELDQILLLQRG